LNAGALARLELPAVRALLAERTAFAPGRELAEALAPTADLREAERLHDETAAARDLLRANPSTGLRGARDIRDSLRRARLGGALDPEQLQEVGDTIRAATPRWPPARASPALRATSRPPSSRRSARPARSSTARARGSDPCARTCGRRRRGYSSASTTSFGRRTSRVCSRTRS